MKIKIKRNLFKYMFLSLIVVFAIFSLTVLPNGFNYLAQAALEAPVFEGAGGN